MSETNGVLFQFFQWYSPSDGTHWNDLASKAPELAAAGFTAIWIPPCSKGSGGVHDVGYGQYDLFDLGEFDQKGSVRTKYGTRDELLRAIRSVQEHGMHCYADVVFNHKDGGDDIEHVWVQEVDWGRRNTALTDWHPIEAFTHFRFPGRGETYSSMKWHWWCFDSLTYNHTTRNTSKLYRLKDKSFETDVSHEHENYDFLMANDLDTGHELVRGELMHWGRWFVDTTGVDGFRIDAIKHIRASFFHDWLNHIRDHFRGRELFSVGEYWSPDIGQLHNYIEKSGGVMSLFDVPLHCAFHDAGRRGQDFDLRKIFDKTLVKERPDKAVTFVENHDTQPFQSLQSPVADWFKPLAYALILLRRDGYPTVFHADYYGAEYLDDRPGCGYMHLPSHRWMIDRFLQARRHYGFGDQHDYFDHPNIIGWTRLGNHEHPGAMAVILSNGWGGGIWMNMFRPNAIFRDITGHIPEKVVTNEFGWGHFGCTGGSVSVWLQE